MTILYLITQGEQGGAQLYVRSLAEAAHNQNMPVNLAFGGNDANWLNQEISAIGGKFWPLEHLKRAPSPLHDCLAIIELVRLYQRLKPDVIHLNSSKAGILGSLAGFIYRWSYPQAKIIYTVHGWVFNEPMSWPLKTVYYLMERITANLKTKIICVSDHDRQVGLKSKIAPASKLITIYNGVEFPDNYFLDKNTARQLISDKLSTNELLLGTIANFYPTKGLKYLIEATKILVNDYNLPVKTIIIGEGSGRMELEKIISELNLQNNIILTGSIKEAGKYLKAFDIAVMSSIKEGLPYFLLEAMSAGLPIVATSVGGIPEMIADSKNGFLVESQNPKMLADKIKKLIDNSEIVTNISENNLITVKNKFNLKTMIDKTLEIYK